MNLKLTDLKKLQKDCQLLRECLKGQKNSKVQVKKNINTYLHCSYISIFPGKQMLSESYSMPQENPMNFTIKEDSKDEDRDKSMNSLFASPKSPEMLKRSENQQFKKNKDWAERTWCNWASHHLKNMSQEKLENGHELDTKLTSMSTESMNYWLGKFLLEVRTVSSKEYSSDSLYQLCWGLHRSLRDN